MTCPSTIKSSGEVQDGTIAVAFQGKSEPFETCTAVLYWVAEHLIHLSLINIKVGGSTDRTGKEGSYSIDPTDSGKCTQYSTTMSCR